MRARIKLRFDRLLSGSLKRLGLREPVIRFVSARRRARRRRAEARGSDALSRPALYGMDIALAAIIDKDRGFFVEAGANDGYMQSNTYWLSRFRNWTGLLVEPMEELYEECVLERPESAVRRRALVADDYTEPTIRMKFGGLMSFVADRPPDEEMFALGLSQGWRDTYEADVPVATLTELLEAIDAPEVDLLSLDVEGFEPQALAGLDLDRWAPRWILVEVYYVDEGQALIEEVLGDRYELDRSLSPIDLLYRRADVEPAA